MKRIYCPNDCDFRRYYQSQAGSGLSDIRIFKGFPYQRGYGIGAFVRLLGVPLLHFLGRPLLSTGMSIRSDMIAKKNIKESVKQRLKEGGKSAAQEGLSKLSSLVEQAGSGRRVYKRESMRKKMMKRRLKKSDIFG